MAREIAVILDAKASLYCSNYDNWNGGTSTWSLRLPISLQMFARFKVDERNEMCETLREIGEPFFSEFDNDHFGDVGITPRADVAPDWRDRAYEFVAGKGISNQARVKSDNPPRLERDGLLFRSEPEINLYVALKAKGLTFAPLPVFLRGGKNYQRLEPDFVVLRNGRLLVVEVDGDTYHRETPKDADARLAPLTWEGAKSLRVDAVTECGTPELAFRCAERIVAALNKLEQQR